jgi:CDP-paratose 2-epimerase
VDNNMRADFFGPEGDTRWNLERLRRACPGYTHRELDIRDRAGVLRVVGEFRPDLLVHAAAQPSHDLAAQRPLDDFDVNAVGTLNLLEAVRQGAPEAVFVFLSTNKVYGDAPNELPVTELPTRWDYARAEDYSGVREDMRLDRSLHSIFGASKVAADVMTQEYGRYFGLRTVCFRCGCLTGPHHSGVQLHGFLNYLFRVAAQGGCYTIFGYRGKQVRDNLHSFDVVAAMEFFYERPRPAEVYNLGGGRENSCSVLEALEAARQLAGPQLSWKYVEQARRGDHICYISDLSKFRAHYPAWRITKPLAHIYRDIARAVRS